MRCITTRSQKRPEKQVTRPVIHVRHQLLSHMLQLPCALASLTETQVLCRKFLFHSVHRPDHTKHCQKLPLFTPVLQTVILTKSLWSHQGPLRAELWSLFIAPLTFRVALCSFSTELMAYHTLEKVRPGRTQSPLSAGTFLHNNALRKTNAAKFLY